MSTFIGSRRTGQARKKGFLFTFFAVMAVAIGVPATANATFSAALSESASTTQAAGHPNLTFTVTPSGTEKLKDVGLALGDGQHFNWDAATSKCTASQLSSDSCPSASQVGTGSSSIKYTSTYTFTGKIYQMVEGSTDAATMGVVLTPPAFVFKPKIMLTIHATTNQVTAGNILQINNIPNSNSGTITVNSLTLTFASKVNSTQSGKYFSLNPSKCAAATTTATLTGYSSSTATATASITPTNCGALAFGTSTHFSPSTLQHGQPYHFQAGIMLNVDDATVQESTLKKLTIDLPPDSGFNFPVLGEIQDDSCNTTDLLADVCGTTHPDSELGNVSSSYPFMLYDQSGNIYATYVGNSMNFGMVTRGERGTKVIATGGYGTVIDKDGDGIQETIRVSFSNIPQDTLGGSLINITKDALRQPDACQDNTVNLDAEGYSGATSPTTDTFPTIWC